jgi:hypothetical protein
MKIISGLYDVIKEKIPKRRSENRYLSYYRNRWDAIDNLADYLVGAEIPGDYLEFGVAKGMTFTYACKVMSPVFPKMRFIALDSFEGLPKPKGVDAENGYSSNFCEGQFSCSEDDFIKNLKDQNIDTTRIRTVKGWFDYSLEDENTKKYNLDKIAAAWIDCDLYESTIPVLKFLTSRLSVGSVILFDDWRCFRNLPDYGEQRACREWLSANPQIKLYELFSFGWHGIVFTVGSC